MNILSELRQKPERVRSMPDDDLRDLILNGLNEEQTVETVLLLNWYIDVYNFRRGKLVIKPAKAKPKKRFALPVRFENYFGEQVNQLR